MFQVSCKRTPYEENNLPDGFHPESSSRMNCRQLIHNKAHTAALPSQKDSLRRLRR